MSSGCSYDVKTGVVVDGCVRRLEVVDPWRSCAGGCLCVHTYTSGWKTLSSIYSMLCMSILTSDY